MQLLVCRGPRPRRSARRGPADARKNADLQQPRRPLRRRNWPDRRGSGQLPAGLHAPLANYRLLQYRPDPQQSLRRLLAERTLCQSAGQLRPARGKKQQEFFIAENRSHITGIVAIPAPFSMTFSAEVQSRLRFLLGQGILGKRESRYYFSSFLIVAHPIGQICFYYHGQARSRYKELFLCL